MVAKDAWRPDGSLKIIYIGALMYPKALKIPAEIPNLFITCQYCPAPSMQPFFDFAFL